MALLFTLPRLLPLAVSLHLRARKHLPLPPPDARQAPSISLACFSTPYSSVGFLPMPTKTQNETKKQKVKAAFWRLAWAMFLTSNNPSTGWPLSLCVMSRGCQQPLSHVLQAAHALCEPCWSGYGGGGGGEMGIGMVGGGGVGSKNNCSIIKNPPINWAVMWRSKGVVLLNDYPLKELHEAAFHIWIRQISDLLLTKDFEASKIRWM